MLITQSNREFYNTNKDNYTHIVSIVCPDEKELTKHISDNHLLLKMWDVDKVLENKFRRYNPPGEGECILVVQWAERKWNDCLRNKSPFILLVHCDAGISRSSAITLGILWKISSNIFICEPRELYLKEVIEARKQWCKSLLDWNNSTTLCRYIDGRFNPGVKPNEAILKFYRKYFSYFPW